MSIGKDLRLRRIIDPITNSSVMFAFSHGTSVPEVMAGLEDPAGSFRKVRDGGIGIWLLHRLSYGWLIGHTDQ